MVAEFRRILITGGTGFVGRYLAEALAKAMPDARITVTVRSGAARADVAGISLDVANRAGMNALIESLRPDLTVHLAAQASVGSAPAAASATWTTNVSGAIALACALARCVPEATVLNVSSAEVYGKTFLEGPVSETSPLRPANVYGRTKATAEEVFSDILPASARLITVRPFNHAGPGQDERFVVASLAAQIARIERGEQKPPVRFGNLDAERDFLDVRDVVRAYVSLIQQAERLPPRTVFNISSGQAIRVSEVLSALLAMATDTIPAAPDPRRMRPSEIPRAAGDASAIRAATGWTPRIALDETLRDVLGAFRNAPSPDLISEEMDHAAARTG